MTETYRKFLRPSKERSRLAAKAVSKAHEMAKVTQASRLRELIEELWQKATPLDGPDGFVVCYDVPAGILHTLLGASRACNLGLCTRCSRPIGEGNFPCTCPPPDTPEGFSYDVDAATRKANANLIAAAPDMLAALEAIARDAGIYATMCSKNDDDWGVKVWSELQHFADAAIKKGRGL